MSYQIELTDDYLNQGIHRVFKITKAGASIDADDAIQIFVSIEIKKHPLFLSSVLAEKAYSQMEYSWILFGECTDANDETRIIVPKQMVGFSIFEDFLLIDKHSFFQLSLDFAAKSLVAAEKFSLTEKGIIDGRWLKNVRNLIPQIEEKIRSLS